MKTLTVATIATVAVALFSFSSCSKQGTGPGDQQSQPGAPNSLGTVSGGGGNGLDNKAIESYAIKIEELPEFKRYIAPIIKKISRGRGDVLAAYMNYVVRQKPWYLIPRDLEDVPKERVGLGFKTEQLALHSEGGVYLHKASYLKKNQKERAELLMHEIVMGARLLMKKSPTEQCEKLAGNEVRACTDPRLMKLAQAQDFSVADQVIMTDVDHDAVRNLTIFLMQRTQEVTSASVTAKRRQLKFYFPWDQASSDLTFEDVYKLLKLANLSDAVYRPTDDYNEKLKDLDVRCRFREPGADDGYIFFNLIESSPSFASEREMWGPGAKHQTPPEAYGLLGSSVVTPITWAGQNRVHLVYRQSGDLFTETGFSARGDVDPNNEKRILDVVVLKPDINVDRIQKALPSDTNHQIELLITREQQPKIIEIRSRPVVLNLKKAVPTSSSDFTIVAQKRYDLRCKLDESEVFERKMK